MTFARSATAVLALMIVPASLTGCVRRTIMITSEPDGALVWLNDREVGRTPVDVDFLYYGTYDVRVVKDGYEPLLTSGAAKPPIWDNVGPDLVAELLPFEVRSEIRWHYELQPRDDDQPGLIERASGMRNSLPVPPSEAPSDSEGPKPERTDG